MVTTIEAMESQFGYLGFGDENALNEEIWVKYGSNYIIESDSSKLQSELELDRQRIDQQIVPYAIVSEFNRKLNEIKQEIREELDSQIAGL